jgi:hypothetical protein
MPLIFRLFAPFILAAWLAAMAFILTHAASAPSNRQAIDIRSAACTEKP